MFRSRNAAIAASATTVLLIALEIGDICSPVDADDELHDQHTSGWFGAAMTAAIGGSIVSLARHRPIPRHRRAWWVGLGVTWTGAIINRVARHHLGANYRSRVTIVPGHEIIQTGPYRHVRHPMYTGSTLICLGLATASAAPTSALWALPILSLIHRIRVEEAALQHALGSTYETYTDDRPRLIPMLW